MERGRPGGILPTSATTSTTPTPRLHLFPAREEEDDDDDDDDDDADDDDAPPPPPPIDDDDNAAFLPEVSLRIRIYVHRLGPVSLSRSLNLSLSRSLALSAN